MPAEANVSLRIELRDLKRDLAQVPELTGREAKLMVNRLEAAYKNSERAAKKAFKATSKSAKVSFDDISRIGERTGSFLGGTFGEMSELALEFTADLGRAAGGMGALAGGATLAGGAVAIAGAATVLMGVQLVALVGYAAEAADRLEEAGLAAIIPTEAQDSIDDYTEASGRLANAASVLLVVVGSKLAPSLTDAADTTVRAIDKALELEEAWERVAGAGLQVARVIVAAGTLLSSEAAIAVASNIEWADSTEDVLAKYEGVSEEAEKAAEEAEKAAAKIAEAEAKADIKAAQEHERAAERRAKASAKASADARKAAETESERVRSMMLEDNAAHLKAAEDRAKADEKAAEAASLATAAAFESARSGSESRLEGLAAIDAAHQRELEKIEELAAAGASEDSLDAARREAELAHLVAVDELEQAQAEARKDRLLEYFDAATDVYSGIAGLVLELMDQELDRASDVVDGEVNDRKRLRDVRLELQDEISSATDAATKAALQLELDAVNEKITAQRKQVKQAKAGFLDQFKANKAAAVSAIVVDGAAGLVKSIATLGPPVPPNFPGIAGTAAVVLTTATQAAAASAASPPKFHGGLSPDERPATLQAGEGVLTAQAVQRAGAGTVKALNDGGELSLDLDPLVAVTAETNRLLARLIDAQSRGSTTAGHRR
jgi:hypothetical protein